ncbi:beta-1,4-N-acetylgalactosaminyltransferase 3 isoform X1 [Hydra vulgaris]|uniref:beta-1,4-N-acetylgalactosaminyltransferase 3 isoform X1 n=1 Tax=Hydra vulgaris TaxID=6087 RepID=UPI001F5F0947|nr:beta-1,4-N-acetylgalactosaminyltransferase 3-like isoform X1 [Hydra vulgaris]
MGNRKLKLLLLFIGIFVLVELTLFCYQQFKDKEEKKVVEEIGVIVAQRGNNLPVNVIVNPKPYSSRSELFKYVSQEKVNSLFYPMKNFIKNKLDACENLANLHIWHEICGIDVKNLKLYPLYPHLPVIRDTVNKLDFNNISPLFGIRIFGYLEVKNNGLTQFFLSTVDISIEVYLSLDSPNNSFLICYQNHLTKQVNTLSDEIYLNKGKYFFDILGKTGIKVGKFSLKWKQSSLMSTFSEISSEHLSCFFNETGSKKTSVILDYKVPEGLPSLFHKKKLSELYSTPEDFIRSTIFTIPLIPEEDTLDLFPDCKYSPSYIVHEEISQYLGIWELHYTKVFPKDNTEVFYRLDTNENQIIFGNDIVLESTAHNIVNQVMAAIKKKHKNKYSLSTILNVEENNDVEKGSRFLVELELINNDLSKKVRFSQYVYLFNNITKLCYPENFQWNKTADVNVILTLGNQGRWAKHFINTMAEVFEETKDINLNVIIVDFNSQDIDMIQALEQSSIPRYTLIKHTGKFHKTLAIQVAANTIINPNAITLQVDLHLTIPSGFIDLVRKHTVQGKMVCSPIVLRLQCGANPQARYGFWESAGYGIFGAYKSDWNRFGGMNTEKFSISWGGEDWELLDTVLKAGYEVERFKVKNFNHVFHTKKGMWDYSKTT